jgi:hypothetical protein
MTSPREAIKKSETPPPCINEERCRGVIGGNLRIIIRKTNSTAQCQRYGVKLKHPTGDIPHRCAECRKEFPTQ